MDNTNVNLSVDFSNKLLLTLSKLTHQFAITLDIGPNIMLAVKYIAGSIVIIKSIDVKFLKNYTNA